MFFNHLSDFGTAFYECAVQRWNHKIWQSEVRTYTIRQFLSYFKFISPPLTSALKKLSKIKSFFVFLSATVEELIYCYFTEFAIRQLNFKPGSTNGRRLIINSNQFTKATQFGKYRKWLARAVHKLAIIKKNTFLWLTACFLFSPDSREVVELWT